jgi:glycosyltransferase involved in cell wall biosynthesis
MIKKGLKPSLVRVISNGIEDEAYLDVDQEASEDIKEKVKNFGRYIIQIGRVYMIKNYETTIRALTNTPEDLKYVIAGPIGDNNYLKKLQKLVKDLNLEDRVIFLGVIRGVDKYYLIKHAQMMVHMALWESFCNVVHEGLSQGLVCIVANNTALPLLIKDGVNGYCVETRDSKKLAERINFVLNNKNTKLIKDMKQVNRAFGLQDSWESVADRMSELYSESISIYKKND